MKKIICGFILFLLMISNAKADECSNVDRERLQKLANNITVNQKASFDVNGSVHYEITLVGVSDELDIDFSGSSMGFDISRNGFKEVTYVLDKSGKTYWFSIQGNQNACMFDTVRTITINTPYYNKYYKDKVCEDAKNYSLCQKWVKVDMSHKEFVQKVNEHKEKNNNIQSNENIQDTKFDFLKNYKKYYWPSLISLIVILGLLVFLWFKENKKNKL